MIAGSASTGWTSLAGSPCAAAGVCTTSVWAMPMPWRVALLIDDLDIVIVALDGSPLRRLVLDPTRDYQRIP